MLYRLSFFALLVLTTTVGKSQTHPPTVAFIKYVSETYRIPDELKYDCAWIYAVVKVKTDNNNKIIKYEFVNDPPQIMKNGFNFLIGYQFPKTMSINQHPLVFYYSIDNSNACKPKEGEHRFYAPNRVIEVISGYLSKLKHDDPHTIIIPYLAIGVVLPIQE